MVRTGVARAFDSRDPTPGSIAMLDGLRVLRREGAILFERGHSGSPTAARRRNWQRASIDTQLSLDTLHRVLGFGLLQARSLLESVGGDAHACRDAIETAAWFNLGIVLFDALLDNGGIGERAIRHEFDDTLLLALATGAPDPFLHHPHGGVALFGSVAADVFAGLRRLAPEAQSSIIPQLLRLFAAETQLSDQTIADDANAQMWRMMRQKSVEPMRVVGDILAGSSSGAVASLHMPELVTIMGHLLWIIDDALDAPEDWARGHWSRPWWVAVRQRRVARTMSIDHALWALCDMNWIDRETIRLRRGLYRLQRRAPRHGDALRHCAALTLAAWVA